MSEHISKKNDEERVVNGGAIASTAGATEKVLSASAKVPQYNSARPIKRSMGYGTSFILYKQSGEALMGGEYGEAREKFIMATANTIRSSETALRKITDTMEKAKIGHYISTGFGVIMSKLPLSGTVMSMSLAGIAAAEEKEKEKSDGVLVIGSCNALGTLAGGAVGSIAGPAGMVWGAFAGSELSSEACARLWQEISPSNVKLKGATSVALYQNSGLQKAVEEGAELLKNNAQYLANAEVSLYRDGLGAVQPPSGIPAQANNEQTKNK